MNRSQAELMREFDPQIRALVRRYAGGDDPELLQLARLEVLRALPRYDPRKASPSTFLHSVLRRLPRLRDQLVFSVPLPARVKQDWNYLQRVRHQLSYELGREPTYQELADKTGMSLERIQRLYGAFEGSAPLLPEVQEDPVLRAFYDSLSVNERRYLEGHKLPPAQVSQAEKNLRRKLEELTAVTL